MGSESWWNAFSADLSSSCSAFPLICALVTLLNIVPMWYELDKMFALLRAVDVQTRRGRSRQICGWSFCLPTRCSSKWQQSSADVTLQSRPTSTAVRETAEFIWLSWQFHFVCFHLTELFHQLWSKLFIARRINARCDISRWTPTRIWPKWVCSVNCIFACLDCSVYLSSHVIPRTCLHNSHRNLILINNQWINLINR